MAEIIPSKQDQAKRIKAEHGDKVLGQVTVEQIFGKDLDLQTFILSNQIANTFNINFLSIRWNERNQGYALGTLST